ncbi:MAG: FliM/FliN family flagellar motor switch protein [Phycisphaeraceae bacterium]|nr:FliM/FliN family flagellar motor switch protein [Phycisphaerae bacterium]MBX3392773.1 FliM/FliN family flagellar motor switch protein [Phycisphaeraceae bacterium]
MRDNLSAILSLEVPIVVRLGQRSLRVGEVLRWVPGALIELPKNADEPLELLVNNRCIAIGSAVKVGENFGLRVERIGSVPARVEAVSSSAEQAPRDSTPPAGAGTFPGG